MKKFGIQIGALLIVIFGALWLSYNQGSYSPLLPGSVNTGIEQSKQLKINDVVITVEVADTPSKRTTGLSGRDTLASNAGMLFVFPETKKYRFWMKDTKIPLDFIYVRAGKVVDVYRNAQPPVPGQSDSTLPQYEPVESIDMMIETNAGFIDQHNVKVGDSVYELRG